MKSVRLSWPSIVFLKLEYIILYIIFKNFGLNLLSKMFVLTEIIDRIFLLFYKILNPVQDGVFAEIALRTLWTPRLHSDNIAHTLATYL
jgi:hypothetical protein